MTRSTLVAIAMLAAVAPLAAQPAPMGGGGDPVIGVWKLNVERSVWSPGPRPPADLVTLREYSTLEGGWMRFTNTSTNQLGAPTFQIGVFKLDGQRHPVHNIQTLGPFMTTGRPSNLTRTYRVIDPRTTESITYTDGAAGLPVVRTVQPDGMSMIETTRGTDAQGPVHNVLVYDRVR
jgi:hypothetical protein